MTTWSTPEGVYYLCTLGAFSGSRAAPELTLMCRSVARQVPGAVPEVHCVSGANNPVRLHHACRGRRVMQQAPQLWCFVCVRCCAPAVTAAAVSQRQYVAGYMPAVVSTGQCLPGAAVPYSPDEVGFWVERCGPCCVPSVVLCPPLTVNRWNRQLGVLSGCRISGSK